MVNARGRRRDLFAYIEGHYNQRRIHFALGYSPPGTGRMQHGLNPCPRKRETITDLLPYEMKEKIQSLGEISQIADDVHLDLIHFDAMPPARFTKLTTRQRECLRLYHQRFRIKEIASTLAISENTASGYLTEAAAIIDAGGRRAAAAALAAFENDHPEAKGRFSAVSQKQTSAGPVPRTAVGPSPVPTWPVDMPVAMTTNEIAAPTTEATGPPLASASFPPLPDHLYPRGRSQAGDVEPPLAQNAGHHRNPAVTPKHDQRTDRSGRPWVPLRQGDGNDLTITRRFIWLGVITFLLVSGFGIFAFFIRTVSDLAGGFAN